MIGESMDILNTDRRGECCQHGDFGDGHACATRPGTPMAEPRSKGGRPKGFDGRRSKMPSAMAQAFKRAGLDWQADFAMAIKANNRPRIKLWLRLLPYMITTSAKARVGKWRGRPSRAAKLALEAMEQDTRTRPI